LIHDPILTRRFQRVEESQSYYLYLYLLPSLTITSMDQDPHQNAEAGPSTPAVVYPTAPVYNFDQESKGVSTVSAGTFDSEVDGNFCRSARWSVLPVDARSQLM
jgi:hypothetical protein